MWLLEIQSDVGCEVQSVSTGFRHKGQILTKDTKAEQGLTGWSLCDMLDPHSCSVTVAPLTYDIQPDHSESTWFLTTAVLG